MSMSCRRKKSFNIRIFADVVIPFIFSVAILYVHSIVMLVSEILHKEIRVDWAFSASIDF